MITHYTIDKIINNGVFLFYAENLLLAQGINKNVNRTWNKSVAIMPRKSIDVFICPHNFALAKTEKRLSNIFFVFVRAPRGVVKVFALLFSKSNKKKIIGNY